MPIYFTGFTSSKLFKENVSLKEITKFTQVACSELTDIEIGCDYLLLWQFESLLISLDPNTLHGNTFMRVQLPDLADNGHCKFVVPHHQNRKISILLTNNVLCEYDIDKNAWEGIGVFTPNISEHAVKIIHCRSNMLLTNLGRVLNMDNYLPIKSNVKFIDIAHGARHVILLGNDSSVYSILMGMDRLNKHNFEQDYIRGPDLISELQGLKIVQIAAGTWHSAAITEQGDLYTWGLNGSGELGHSNCIQEVQLVPQLVNIEFKVKKVQCGECFTICLADDGTLWGSGINIYSELGAPRTSFPYSMTFIKLDIRSLDGKVKDFKSNESGTAIITD